MKYWSKAVVYDFVDPDLATVMTDIEALIADLRQFVAERDWSQFHDPKNLVMLLASEVGELVAEYRWVAGDAADAHSRDDGAARERIVDEVGDVGIALLLLCDRHRDRSARGGGGEAREEPRAVSGGQGARESGAARGVESGSLPHRHAQRAREGAGLRVDGEPGS